MSKKLLFILCVFMLSFLSCSIDKLTPDPTFSFTTEKVEPNGSNPGGYIIHFIENGVETNSIFISNGYNGKDGKDGINGINGINGKDGVSVTVSTEKLDNGYNLTITSVEGTKTIFIANGKDGTNGLDGLNGKDGKDGKDGINGINGINGKDGVSVTVSTEKLVNGYNLTITSVEGTKTIFIANGTNGTNGLDGLNGKDGTNGTNGVNGVSSTIRTERVTGGYNMYITVGSETNMIFIADGKDGTNGLDGKNGTNGVDGVSSTIRTERVTGGYNMYITVGTETTTIFIPDGKDGTNGLDGKDGTNGVDGIKSFIYVNNIVGGEECPDGGVEILTGMDNNRNGVLDFDETTYTYICSCNCEDNNEPKTTICHKKKIGNDWKFVTLYVPASAVSAHLAHGDELGKCN